MKRSRMSVSITTGLALLTMGMAVGPASAAIDWLTVDPTAKLVNNGTQVLVSGLIRADADETDIVYVEVLQTKGGETAIAGSSNNYETVQLTRGVPFGWGVLTEPAFGVRFASGPALAHVVVYGNGGSTLRAQLWVKVKLNK